MTKTFHTIEAFRASLKDGGPLPDGGVLASFDTSVKAGEGDSRSLTFTISTGAVDRMGDTVDPNGWQLENYRKNPVVLWAHDSSSLPVARAPKIWVDKGALKAEAEFTPKGLVRFNDIVHEMYKGGFLSATSVGFAPLKYAFVDDATRKFGIAFMEQELLEFSTVPVPANPEALIESRSAGIDVDVILDWAEGALSKAGAKDRITKLADQILGADHQASRDLEWARQIAIKAGMNIYSQERIDSVERAATSQRIAAAKAKKQREIEILRMGGKVA